MSAFPERLRELKERGHYTLKEMSEALDISVSNLSYYMKDREPSYDTLIKIADCFGVTTDWLLGISDSRDEIQDLLAFKVEAQKSIEQTVGFNPDLPEGELDQNNLLHGEGKRVYLYIQQHLYDCLIIFYDLLNTFYKSSNSEFQEKGYTYLSLMAKTFHGFLSYFEILDPAANDFDYFKKKKVLEAIKYGELTGTLLDELIHKFTYEFIPYLISISNDLNNDEKKELTTLITFLSSKYDLEHPIDTLKEYDKYISEQRAEVFQKLYRYMTPEEIEDMFESYIHTPSK